MASEMETENLSESLNTTDDIIARHRREKKELQAHTQKLKHEIPKGDKKKKKEVTEQIAKLEADLDSKHTKELQDLKGNVKEDHAVTDDCKPTNNHNVLENTTKKSKAQRRRDKKSEAEREREGRIKAQEVENRLGPRHIEMVKIKEILKQRGLALYEIAADGDCLYSAISHQLQGRSQEVSVKGLRQQTAEYIRTHKDDFLPFLTHPDTGDSLNDDEFDQYCDKIDKQPVWGGQIELRAMSEVLRIPIEVIQAESESLVIGDRDTGEPIILVYHHHIYRLGEHYNSTVAQSDPVEQPETSETG